MVIGVICVERWSSFVHRKTDANEGQCFNRSCQRRFSNCVVQRRRENYGNTMAIQRGKDKIKHSKNYPDVKM